MYMITKKKKCLVLIYFINALYISIHSTICDFTWEKKFPLNFTFCKMKYPL